MLELLHIENAAVIERAERKARPISWSLRMQPSVEDRESSLFAGASPRTKYSFSDSRITFSAIPSEVISDT